MRGKFITIEGTEGVGKTTNIQFIQSWLHSKQLAYLCTREPGGTPLAEQIRELLLAPREELVCDTAELLLMFAGRAQHLNQVIEPALEEGAWVLCDRFTDATYAYQGAGRGLDLAVIQRLEQLCLGDFQPDLTLILDLPIEAGMARAAERGELDRFESEDIAFFQRVRQGFLDRAATADRYRVIDASQSLAQVQTQVRQIITSLPVYAGGTDGAS